MAQVRSVNELSDVQPTDWAYGALQSLIERYGLSFGYPDGTFRGNRALSRYEFAAALRQVIEAVELQLRTAPFNQLQEDFATLRRLQAAYSEITADLQGRFNQLNTAIDQLEQRQFSTTTQLSGQVIGSLTDGTDANATLVDRVRLGLRTSFSGQDLLLTELEAGNNGEDAVSQAQNRGRNYLGTEGVLADGGGLDTVGVDGQPRLRSLYYTFQPVKNVSMTVGARLAPGDFIDDNRFANNSFTNFSSSFFMHNPLIVQNQIDRHSGAGAVVAWQPENFPLAVRALYAAADAERPNQGLFGDRNQTSLELEYAPSKNLALRLQYTHANINDTKISAGGVNAEWALSQTLALFGRYGFGHYEGYNSQLDRNLDLNPQTWAVGFIARRLFIPGSTAGVAVGQPFIEDDLGNATQTNIEAFYRFLLNDNVSFSPTLIVVTNPDNDRSNTIWQWVVQMVFSF